MHIKIIKCSLGVYQANKPLTVDSRSSGPNLGKNCSLRYTVKPKTKQASRLSKPISPQPSVLFSSRMISKNKTKSSRKFQDCSILILIVWRKCNPNKGKRLSYLSSLTKSRRSCGSSKRQGDRSRQGKLQCNKMNNAIISNGLVSSPNTLTFAPSSRRYYFKKWKCLIASSWGWLTTLIIFLIAPFRFLLLLVKASKTVKYQGEAKQSKFHSVINESKVKLRKVSAT